MLHKLLHIFKKKAPKYSVIPCLDERILEKIYQHLSLVDQVCLSLSCKDLFSLFGKIVKHKDLEFPRLLRIRIPILCVNSPHVLRNQLFLRLENHRWAYCAKCLKLHTRAQFTKYSLGKSALERSCTFKAGIVDICPCISLTRRGRDRFIKILKSRATPAKTKYMAHWSIILTVEDNLASVMLVYSVLGLVTMQSLLRSYPLTKAASYM